MRTRTSQLRQSVPKILSAGPVAIFILLAPNRDGVGRTYCCLVVSCKLFIILPYAVPLLLSTRLFSFALMNLAS